MINYCLNKNTAFHIKNLSCYKRIHFFHCDLFVTICTEKNYFIENLNHLLDLTLPHIKRDTCPNSWDTHSNSLDMCPHSWDTSPDSSVTCPTLWNICPIKRDMCTMGHGSDVLNWDITSHFGIFDLYWDMCTSFWDTSQITISTNISHDYFWGMHSS